MVRRSGVLRVLMSGIAVGSLHSSASGVLTFRYEPSWLESELRRPISLSLPLAEREYSGPVVENSSPSLQWSMVSSCRCDPDQSSL